MVENLTPQLADFFGAKGGQGVLVRSVERGSRAERAGFRAGDVIVKIEGQPVNDAGDFSHALRSRKGNTVSVGILRDKKEQTLTLALPDRKQSSVFDESFELPDIDAEAHIDLSNLNSQMAKLRPQMELAVKQAQEAIKQVQKEMCRSSQEMRKQQKQQMQEQRKELKKQKDSLQNELRDEQQEIQREIHRELRSLSEI
jgi:C-terminal processing protease CtpA/Prc